MKKLITCLSILLLAVSCNTNKHVSAAAIGLVNLDHYAVKENADLPYAFNYLVITNQVDFDNTFGITASGAININYPGFKGQAVVACITRPSNSTMHIRFDKAEVAGKGLNVYCTALSGEEKLKQAAPVAALATVPKVLSVKRIVFFTNGEKAIVRTINLQEENRIVKRAKADDVKPIVLKRVMRRPAVI